MKTIEIAQIVFREDLYPRIETSAITVQKYAESLEAKIRKGVCMLYSHGMWIGYIDKGNVYFSNHNTSFCRAVYTKWNEINKEEFQDDLICENEKCFCDRIQKTLEINQFSVKREVNTRFGRIDLLAQKNVELMIIEAKTRIDSNSISSALGQLLFYGSEYPDASLWIAAPQKINKDAVKLLKKYNVSFMEVV